MKDKLLRVVGNLAGRIETFCILHQKPMSAASIKEELEDDGAPRGLSQHQREDLAEIGKSIDRTFSNLLSPRARRSNWDAYAMKYEREHGPNKPPTRVQADATEILRKAKEELDAS